MLVPLLSWSQSYPTQRVIGKDTVVIMTKKQAGDINIVFRQNNLQISKLKHEIDSLKKLPAPQRTVRGTLLLHDTVTVRDTLTITDTIRNSIQVNDTTYPRLKGSVLLPKGDYWLYTFNEKTQRYEMDRNSVEAQKVEKGDRIQVNILTVWSITVMILTSMVYFLGV
jgi:hypothetical protein